MILSGWGDAWPAWLIDIVHLVYNGRSGGLVEMICKFVYYNEIGRTFASGKLSGAPIWLQILKTILSQYNLEGTRQTHAAVGLKALSLVRNDEGTVLI